MNDASITGGFPQLHCGPDAQFTGPGALRVHGLRYGPDDDRVHMLVPQACHLGSSEFVVVHRTKRLPRDPSERGTVRIAAAARAVADTARMCSDFRQVRGFVAEAVQSGRVTVP